MKKKILATLDKADRDVLEAGVKEVAKKQRAEEYSKEKNYVKRFKDEGAEVYELSADEIKAFEKSVAPVYDYQRKLVGDEMIEKWLKTRP